MNNYYWNKLHFEEFKQDFGLNPEFEELVIILCINVGIAAKVVRMIPLGLNWSCVMDKHINSEYKVLFLSLGSLQNVGHLR